MGAHVTTETNAATREERIAWVNEVRLAGRVSGTPQEKTLPSGDAVVLFRLVVRRPVGRRPTLARSDGKSPVAKGAVVDTLDVACWTARPRKAALRLDDGDVVEVTGSLHRRFFRAGGAAASRYEVAAATVTRARR